MCVVERSKRELLEELIALYLNLARAAVKRATELKVELQEEKSSKTKK